MIIRQSMNLGYNYLRLINHLSATNLLRSSSVSRCERAGFSLGPSRIAAIELRENASSSAVTINSS